MGTLLQDIRYGLRGFLRTPGFALTVVLTIALGIGATTAVFSVVDLALFRGLPYPHQERLVSVGMVAPIERTEFMLGTDYVEWRSQQSPFEAFTSMMPGLDDCDLTEQNPARLSCAAVESTFLPTFGIQPLLGRNFTKEEDQPKAPRVVLLSYGTWRGRFGGDPNIVGKTISLDTEPARIVGVLPADFEFPTLARPDLVLPQALPEAEQHRPNTGRVLRTFARLKPGVTIEQGTAALQPLFQESLKWVPPQFRKEVSLRVRSVRDRQVGDIRLAFWILFGAVITVLLIACANVANLLLARTASRQRELAVRAALGAARFRLIRQALTESLLLSLAGGIAGCVLAQMLLRLFLAIAPEGIPRLQDARLDSRVLLFALGASVLSGVLFGLAPALHAPNPEALAGRLAIGSSRGAFRQILVAVQVAVSLVLLAGASLLLRSLWNLENEPLGMRYDSVMTANVVLGQNYPKPAQQLSFFDELEQKLPRLPGVTGFALSDSLPPGGQQHFTLYAAIRVDGRPLLAEGTGGTVAWRSVTPGYFSALQIPILRGRGFSEDDRRPDQYSLILNDTLARRMFPAQNPIGQRLQPGLEGPYYTVIGVAKDVKNSGIDVPADPEFYYTRRHSADDIWLTRNGPSSAVIIRSPMSPKAMAEWVRSEIAELDPNLPVTLESMNQRVSKFAEKPRFDAVLLSMFASMGVLLAAIGIYGVISFLVTQRTQEIGVRMALGARTKDILRWVTANGLKPVIAGGVVGLIAGLVASRILTSLLFSVKPHDPTTFCIAAVILLAIGLIASYVPARRATQVDPMVALRHE
jgi:putative ABC transport system permease protein